MEQYAANGLSYRDIAYFEAMYQRDPDPWRFASSEYERKKYAATLAALPRRRFSRCLEVGCSIGVLTRQLATRCDHTVAVDVSPTALASAQAHCAGDPSIAFQQRQIPKDWPDDRFDLIVFSEVLYYLGAVGIKHAAERTAASLSPGGAVVLVNWTGPTSTAHGGDAAVELFMAAAPTLKTFRADRTHEYRLDVLT